MVFSIFWADLIFILYLGLAVAMTGIREYRPLIMVNIAACICFTTYMYLHGHYVAAASPAIAGICGAIQLLLPQDSHQRGLIVRNAIALICIALAAQFLYTQPIDILPCIGFACMRLAEARHCNVTMRSSMMLSWGLWVFYGLYSGLYLFVGVKIILVSLLMYQLLKLVKQPQEQDAVPA